MTTITDWLTSPVPLHTSRLLFGGGFAILFFAVMSWFVGGIVFNGAVRLEMRKTLPFRLLRIGGLLAAVLSFPSLGETTQIWHLLVFLTGVCALGMGSSRERVWRHVPHARPETVKSLFE